MLPTLASKDAIPNSDNNNQNQRQGLAEQSQEQSFQQRLSADLTCAPINNNQNSATNNIDTANSTQLLLIQYSEQQQSKYSEEEQQQSSVAWTTNKINQTLNGKRKHKVLLQYDKESEGEEEEEEEDRQNSHHNHTQINYCSINNNNIGDIQSQVKINLSDVSVKMKSDAVDDDAKLPTIIQLPQHQEKTNSGQKQKSSQILANPRLHYEELLLKIFKMREDMEDPAPIDLYGPGRQRDMSQPKSVQDFHIFTSLVLSAQTHEKTMDKATRLLITEGWDVDKAIAINEQELFSKICKVTHAEKKVGYLKQCAAIFKEKYRSTVPYDYSILVQLPGVGPKTAILYLQMAAGKVVGIGVDTHVHCVVNRLGWVNTKTPEQTEKQLQGLIAKKYWEDTNKMVAGFGQVICKAVNPACHRCALNEDCPEGIRKMAYSSSVHSQSQKQQPNHPKSRLSNNQNNTSNQEYNGDDISNGTDFLSAMSEQQQQYSPTSHSNNNNNNNDDSIDIRDSKINEYLLFGMTYKLSNSKMSSPQRTFTKETNNICQQQYQKHEGSLHLEQDEARSDNNTEDRNLKQHSPDDLLPNEFYAQDVVTLAEQLLGKYIVRKTDQGIIKCMIVETEAYKGPHDKGCHAYNNKRTEKTKWFWQEGGHLYMYTIYSNANVCMNVTAGKDTEPEAVLIRAVEPIQGTHLIHKNRPNVKWQNLTNGPAKLTKGMNISMQHNGTDIRKLGELYITKGTDKVFKIDKSKRINIGYAEEWQDKLWRFTLRGNSFVSK